MISNSIAVLTALTMLAHSMWGCCWHHSHGVDHPAACAVARSGHRHVAAHVGRDIAGHSNRCCDDRSRSVDRGVYVYEDDAEHNDGPAHEPCDEVRCTFVTTSPVNFDGLLAATVAIWPMAPELSAPLTKVASRKHAADTRAPLSAPSLRAMTQTWLL